MNKRYAIILIIFAIVTLAPIKSVFAQGCAGVTFLVEAEAKIDQNAICQAAQSFVSRGLQVYVYVTDKRLTGSEDDWFAIRDRVEGNWGIYNPGNKTFSKTAVAIELTTDTSKPWGQDFAFGEALFGTPLNTDAAVALLEGKLKNSVTGGNVSDAIVSTFQNAQTIAFPPLPTQGPTVVYPTPIPIPTSVPLPTIAPLPTSMPKPVVVIPEVPFNQTPLFHTIMIILIIGLAGGAVMVLTVYVFIPVYKNLKRKNALNQHINALKRGIVELLTPLDILLKGDKPEDTIVYVLWQGNGGEKYPDMDKTVRENLKISTAALAKAYDAWRAISEFPLTNTIDNLGQRIQQLETLYLTIVGTSQKILRMTHAELLDLLNPLSSSQHKEQDIALLQPLEDILRLYAGEGALAIEFQMVDPSQMEREGILGRIDQIKQALFDLTEAKEKGPAALQSMVELRQTVGSSTTPSTAMQSDPFTYPDGLIAQAQEAVSKERWLDVQQLAEKATDVLNRLPKLLENFAKEVEAKNARMTRILTLQKEGYRYTDGVTSALAEVDQDIAKVQTTMAAGDLNHAAEWIAQIEVDSTRALETLQALATLRIANEKELARLSGEVADLEVLRTGTVEAQWNTLKAYPQTNWETVATAFESATATLAGLFDNPTNGDDLSSSIATANSMETQEFNKAEQMLVEAFKDLADAKGQLTSITHQLEAVLSLEQSLNTTIADTKTAILKAQSRRDQDNSKIDAAVDQMITDATSMHAQATTAFATREFTQAQEAITQAIALATKAYAEADEQAKTIDHLTQELTKSRSAATERLAQLETANRDITPAALLSDTSPFVEQAKAAYASARQTDGKVGGEDQWLATSTKDAIDAYDTAKKAISRAIGKLDSDQSSYNELIAKAERESSSAQSAIRNAKGYVTDSDANGSGTAALNEAIGLLPGSFASGLSRDAIERIIAAANSAGQAAKQAQRQAQLQIAAVEAERQRRLQAEADARRQREQHAALLRASSMSSSSISHQSSMSSSSSSHTSSMGSSSSRNSSSMGSSSRR